jgi:AAA family ATP:ADP antiporter
MGEHESTASGAMGYTALERFFKGVLRMPIEAGEGARLVLCALYFFLVLFSYYMLRPVRETMGVEWGFDKLAWLMTGTLLVMLLANPVYSWFVSRVPRRVFIPWTYRFFILNILVFFGLLLWKSGEPPKWMGYSFYIWLSVFNLFVVSIFWSVMADVHSPGQAKRLFGAIGVGGTLGAMGGAAATGHLSGLLGAEHMGYLLLVSAVVLEGSVWVAGALLRGSGEAQGPAASREPSPRMMEGLRLIARSAYLQKIAFYMFLFTITATVLYVEQARVISGLFPDRADRTRAFASLDLWTNAVTLFTQLFLTARIIRWIGLTGALVIVPVIMLLGFGAMAWVAGLTPQAGAGGTGVGSVGGVGGGIDPGAFKLAFVLLFIFQVARRGLHYAIDRPARETLYTITSVDEKYKSKAFIDTFVYRLGDQVGAWGTVGAYATLSAATALMTIAMPVAALWIGSALVLGRAYAKRASQERIEV